MTDIGFTSKRRAIRMLAAIPKKQVTDWGSVQAVELMQEMHGMTVDERRELERISGSAGLVRRYEVWRKMLRA